MHTLEADKSAATTTTEGSFSFLKREEIVWRHLGNVCLAAMVGLKDLPQPAWARFWGWRVVRRARKKRHEWKNGVDANGNKPLQKPTKRGKDDWVYFDEAGNPIKNRKVIRDWMIHEKIPLFCGPIDGVTKVDKSVESKYFPSDDDLEKYANALQERQAQGYQVEVGEDNTFSAEAESQSEGKEAGSLPQLNLDSVSSGAQNREDESVNPASLGFQQWLQASDGASQEITGNMGDGVCRGTPPAQSGPSVQEQHARGQEIRGGVPGHPGEDGLRQQPRSDSGYWGVQQRVPWHPGVQGYWGNQPQPGLPPQMGGGYWEHQPQPGLPPHLGGGSWGHQPQPGLPPQMGGGYREHQPQPGLPLPIGGGSWGHQPQPGLPLPIGGGSWGHQPQPGLPPQRGGGYWEHQSQQEAWNLGVQGGASLQGGGYSEPAEGGAWNQGGFENETRGGVGLHRPRAGRAWDLGVQGGFEIETRGGMELHNLGVQAGGCIGVQEGLENPNPLRYRAQHRESGDRWGDQLPETGVVHPDPRLVGVQLAAVAEQSVGDLLGLRDGQGEGQRIGRQCSGASSVFRHLVPHPSSSSRLSDLPNLVDPANCATPGLPEDVEQRSVPTQGLKRKREEDVRQLAQQMSLFEGALKRLGTTRPCIAPPKRPPAAPSLAMQCKLQDTFRNLNCMLKRVRISRISTGTFRRPVPTRVGGKKL
jgi:hypothetical protein